MSLKTLLLSAAAALVLSAIMPAHAAETTATAAKEEFRAVWLTRNELLEGRENLEKRLDALSDAGFNRVAVLTQMRGYTALADSDVLPQWPELAKADPKILDWLVPAIQERGMKADAWTEYGFYAYWTPDKDKDPSRGAILDKKPEMTALTAKGLPYHHDKDFGYFYAFCPSNPETHEVLIRLYCEMLEKHPFDGLNLDRIRFTTDLFCHCDHCKSQFRKDTGIELADEFTSGSKGAAAWDGWRKEQTRSFVRKLSAKMRADFPGRMLTSAVVMPDMIDEKGQDWPTWVEKGYVDGVMPMLYGNTIDKWVAWIRNRLPDDGKVFYGLDAGQGMPTFANQVRHLRKLGAPGFTVWEAGSLGRILPEYVAEMKKK